MLPAGVTRTVTHALVGGVVLLALAACGGGEGGDGAGPTISPTRTPTATVPSPTRTGPDRTESPEEPSPTRTEEPTEEPTQEPTEEPTQEPTESPGPLAPPTRPRPPTSRRPRGAPHLPSRHPPRRPPPRRHRRPATPRRSPARTPRTRASRRGSGGCWPRCCSARPWPSRWWCGPGDGARGGRRWPNKRARSRGSPGTCCPSCAAAARVEQVAGGWAVGRTRVTAAEDRLTVLESTAPDDIGRERARSLRDAVRRADAGMAQLTGPGPHDEWALDLDAIIDDLEHALRPAPSTDAGRATGLGGAGWPRAPDRRRDPAAPRPRPGAEPRPAAAGPAPPRDPRHLPR